MNTKSISFAVVLSICLVCVTTRSSECASPLGAASDKQEIRKVLLLETKDETATVDRRNELHPAVNAETASNAAWWQSAFVKIGNGWRPVEKSHLDADTALWNEYRARRDAAPKTAEGQLKLANWCQSHKLLDQERAHLTQVLELSSPNVDGSPVYQRLGYRRVRDRWISPGNLQKLLVQAEKADEQLRQFKPAVERIVQNWFGNAKQRKQAADELEGLCHVDAIPALLAISGADESLANRICIILERIRTFESSQALATIAVHSDWESVRQASIRCLKGRRIDDFAPALLSEMRSPISTVRAYNTSTEPRLIFREEANKFVAVEVQFNFGGAFAIQNLLIDPGIGKAVTYTQIGPRDPTAIVISQSRAGIDQSRFVDDIDRQIQTLTDEADDRAEELNRRSACALSAVTGQQMSSNPRYWWAWWSLHTGVSEAPKKIELLAANVQLPPQIINLGNLTLGQLHSCLIAGTPVWTERGFVSVEQIEVGDRVLAKDIATGQIEYKPVLHTTQRRPVPVKRFVVGGEAIVASDGHHFWVSGEGWQKTRELKSGLPIHTVIGMNRVESVETEPQPAPVYNLVVADFHTYFIGPAMILSHDVTPPEPTNVKVPGLFAP